MNETASSATTFPVGHVFDILFPRFTPRITIDSAQQLSFEIIEGDYLGLKETVSYQSVSLRPGLFMVTWQEKSNATVVHIEDFALGIVYTNITYADHTFIRMSGQMRAVVPHA